MCDTENNSNEMVLWTEEKTYKANDSVLGDIMCFAEQMLDRCMVSPKTAMQITVALEEMIVNVCHYAYPQGDGNLTLKISSYPDKLSFEITDAGIEFDPLKKDDPDITLSAEERDIGGLGIFMVKKTMDFVDYKRQDGKNIFTMTKLIGENK